MPFQQRPAETNPALEPLLPQEQPEPETSEEAPAAENLRESCSLINDPAEVQILSEPHEPVESAAQNLSHEPPAPATAPVTAPLKKPRLKELIKLFAEAIKEYDLVEDVELSVGKYSSQDGMQSPHHHDKNPNTDKDIAKLWRNVKPMELEIVRVDPQAQLEFHKRYSSVDDLYKLFIDKKYPFPYAPPFIEIHACLLRWRLSELQKARLNFEEEFEESYFDESIGPLIQGQIVTWEDSLTELRVMVCCCLSADGGQNQIGHILQHCYRLGALKQPLETSSMEHMDQVSMIVSCLFILNDVSDKGIAMERNSVEKSNYGTSLLATIKDIDKILLGITLPQIFGLTIKSVFTMVQTRGWYNGICQEESRMDDLSQLIFRIDDLNIYSLQEIGKLDIRWTAFVDKHLLLDVRQSILWVSWKWLPWLEGNLMERLYNICVQSSPFIPQDQYPLASVNYEVMMTQAILFASKDSLKKRVLAYSRIQQPGWVSDVAAKDHQESHCGGGPLRDALPDGPLREKVAEKSQFRYIDFPIFEDRLRQLRHYMDTQKPRTFRQMWKDKRDTSNYFTFWAVIIFGGLSVLLAFLSLAVSIAQTVASFKALNLSAQSGPPN